MKKRKNPHRGSTFDTFLKEVSIYEEVTASAIKQVIALQLQEEMQKKKLTQHRDGKTDGDQQSYLKTVTRSQ
jgi:antitoxin HicB